MTYYKSCGKPILDGNTLCLPCSLEEEELEKDEMPVVKKPIKSKKEKEKWQ